MEGQPDMACDIAQLLLDILEGLIHYGLGASRRMAKNISLQVSVFIKSLCLIRTYSQGSLNADQFEKLGP